MVEYNSTLDSLFLSLADSTRRDMLRLLRVYSKLTVGEIAAHYNLTFAGVSKHLKVLEAARLVRKRKNGKYQVVSLNPASFKQLDDYLREYEDIWKDRFDRMETLLVNKE